MLEIFFIGCFVAGILYVFIPLFYSPKKKQEGRELIRACYELISACNDRIDELEVEAFYADSLSEKASILREQKKLQEKIRLTEIKIKGIKTRYGL